MEGFDLRPIAISIIMLVCCGTLQKALITRNDRYDEDRYDEGGFIITAMCTFAMALVCSYSMYK